MAIENLLWKHAWVEVVHVGFGCYVLCFGFCCCYFNATISLHRCLDRWATLHFTVKFFFFCKHPFIHPSIQVKFVIGLEAVTLKWTTIVNQLFYHTSQRTHAGAGRTMQSHKEAPGGFEPRTFLPPCCPFAPQVSASHPIYKKSPQRKAPHGWVGRFCDLLY